MAYLGGQNLRIMLPAKSLRPPCKHFVVKFITKGMGSCKKVNCPVNAHPLLYSEMCAKRDGLFPGTLKYTVNNHMEIATNTCICGQSKAPPV